ncbi:hypothetical protein D915_009460 [Fasciola hepatica]|uniref:Uncharacterized protein n=1 Tax=Fasciola hepatica TaxID=6192 RepID=A0A4E0QY86_FASHE|nr:hypothetical protein D915_009460 [Fasciola hepatica]
MSKIKILSTCSTQSTIQININNEQTKHVPAFKYLDSIFLSNGQTKDEVKLRIDNARIAFLQLHNAFWGHNEISLRIKVRVFRVAIRPILTYGCEARPLRFEDIRRLEVFDHWCLRRVLKVGWHNKLSNDTIRQRCFEIEKLSVFLQRQQLRWFGHILRYPTTEISKQCLSPVPSPGWRCRPGGQLKTWASTVKSNIQRLGLQFVYDVRKWKYNWISLFSGLASDCRL